MLNSPIKLALVESMLDRNTEAYYLNEAVDKDAFRKLPLKEAKLVRAEYALNEFVNATRKDVLDLIANSDEVDASTFDKISSEDLAFFKDLDNAQGDINRTKYNAAVISLLKTSMSVNDAMGSQQSPEQQEYSHNASIILRAISLLAQNARQLREIIQAEAANGDSKKLGTSFFKLAVYLIQVSADLLYSNSIQADFDYTTKVPTVASLRFEYPAGLIDNQLTYINFISSRLSNGSLVKALQPTLSEACDQAVEQVKLNENILDVIVGLVTHNTFTDLLLFPVYLIRFLIYSVRYTFNIYKNISTGIEASIGVQKARIMTKSDFESFKAGAQRRATVVNHANDQAEVKMRMEANQDKRALSNLQTSSVMI
jgi:hypothetical protein